MNQSHPAISVLIRTKNSAGTLEDVIGRLGLATRDELVIVDSGSTDATLALAEKHQARILISNPPFNYSKSLNLGFRTASRPWVLVISSHCVPLCAKLLDVFREAIPKFPENLAVAYGERTLTQRMESPGTTVLFADRDTALAKQYELVFGSSGNGLALYRHVCWQRQPFDESLVTAEDLAWFLRAMETGAMAARLPQARVLNRNQGSLRHMFRKGWLESRMANEMTGASAASLFQLGINLASLLKKWARREIPGPVFLRQAAHAVGAYLSPKFSDRRGKIAKAV